MFKIVTNKFIPIFIRTIMSVQSISNDVFSKLDNYGYPPVVHDIVMHFTRCVQNYCAGQEVGVLLVGSAARGELSWVRDGERLELYSDLEFIVAVNNKRIITKNELRESIKNVETGYEIGALFHIDYSVIDWKDLNKLDTKFFVFESKKCGIECTERSVSDCLPDVTISNLNWSELNEVLLHRVSSMLHVIPLSIFSNASDYEKKICALSIAKNTLDLTTWLHPYEAVELKVGFRNRLACWDSNFIKNSVLGKYFTLDDIQFLKTCLELRMMPNNTVDINNMLNISLSMFSKAVNYCKEMNNIQMHYELSSPVVSIGLFREYDLKERIRQAVSIIRNCNEFGVIMCIRNVFFVRKGVAASFCLNMLYALIFYINRKEQYNSYIDFSIDDISHFIRYKKSDTNRFEEVWTGLRKLFKKYQLVTHNY